MADLQQERSSFGDMGGVLGRGAASFQAATLFQIGIILLVYTFVCVVRVTAPSDLFDGDQPKQLAYICDLVRNGAWMVQHLADGTVASKPPLYNWLTAGPILLTGAWSDLLVKLPSLIAGLIVLLLTWDIARRLVGDGAAFLAALLLTTTGVYVKLSYFARTDMLLVMFMTVQMWAALTRRPIAFWTAAALAMLTKGPIGLMTIPALSAWWWWRGDFWARWREFRPTIGAPLALLPFAIWFAAALLIEGRPLYQQLVIAETVDRFVPTLHPDEHQGILYYIPYFLGRMAPASVFAVLALCALPWRSGRREDIFMAAFWFVTMFLILSLVPSKRIDRLLPILPAVCILAGWAIYNQVRGARSGLFGAAIVFLVLGGSLGLGWPESLYDGIRPGSDGLLRLAGAVLGLSGAVMVAAMTKRRPMVGVAMVIVAMLVVITTYELRLSRAAKASEAQPVCVTQSTQMHWREAA